MRTKLLTFTLLCFTPFSALAFSTTLSDTYFFGHGDSIVTAEKMLLESIKQNAANQAGVYIQSDKTLTSAGLSESIQMISASIVKLEILKKQKNITKDGVFFLTITAKANIDDSELRSRIAAIQNDQNKDKLIKSLQKDQTKLLAKLNQLKLELGKKGLTRSKVSEILSEQSDLSEQMLANVDAVGQVFKRGSLLSMASKASSEDKNVKEKFKKKYLSFWKKQNKQLKASVYEILQEAPNKYRLTVKVEMDNLITKSMHEIVSLAYNIGKYGDNAFEPLTKTMYVGGSFERYRIQEMNPTKKKLLLSRLEYAFYNPVYLSVGIPSKQTKIQFFGVFTEGFFSSSAFQKWNKEPFSTFRDAAYDIGYSKMIIGFRNKTHDDKIYRKNGKTNSFFFDIYLTRKEAESANKVTAKFSF